MYHTLNLKFDSPHFEKRGQDILMNASKLSEFSFLADLFVILLDGTQSNWRQTAFSQLYSLNNLILAFLSLSLQHV